MIVADDKSPVEEATPEMDSEPPMEDLKGLMTRSVG